MIHTIRSGSANCYLLRPEGGGAAILVDAGMAPEKPINLLDKY